MIYNVLDAILGWLKRPPLLWNATDFVMCLCCITLLILAVSELKKKRRYKFFVSYTYNIGDFDTFEFNTNFKPKGINKIKEMEKAIEKQTGRNKVVILYITELF